MFLNFKILSLIGAVETLTVLSWFSLWHLRCFFEYSSTSSINVFLFFSDNKARVYYGLLKEPDVSNAALEDEDDDEEGGDKPKKKKSKKDHLFSKKSKSDPNAPPADRMPLPEL